MGGSRPSWPSSKGEDRGLEKQFALFQEGMELARFCEKKLSEVEKSVEIVLKESAEEWKTAPFDADGAERMRMARD